MITPAKKKIINNRVNNLKLIICILTTNLMLYFFLFQGQTHTLEEKTDSDISHPGFSKLELPVRLYIPIKKNTSSVPVSIYFEKEIIIKQAFLHPKTNQDQNGLLNNSNDYTEESGQLQTIEIPESDVDKIIKLKKNNLSVYPYRKEINNQPSTNKVSYYEIRF